MATTSSKTLGKKKYLPTGEGGTACGIMLEHEHALVIAADRYLVPFEITEEPFPTDKGIRMVEVRKPVEYDAQDVDKLFVLKKRFAIVGIGMRKYVKAWLADLNRRATNESSLEECHRFLEEYRVTNLADLGNHETVEILLGGYNANGIMKMYYFHNGGRSEVTRYSIGKGSPNALIALAIDNKQISALTVEDAKATATRAVYDAYLLGAAGSAVDVLVIRPGCEPEKLTYTMEQLNKKFNTTHSTYMERRALGGSVGSSSSSHQ